MRQCLDYMCRLSALGNSPTASGSSDHGVTVGPSCNCAVGILFFVLLCNFHILFFLLTFFLCAFALFYSCSCHAQMFAKTPLHEFHISYSYTEWSFLFLLGEMVRVVVEASLIKIKIK